MDSNLESPLHSSLSQLLLFLLSFLDDALLLGLSRLGLNLPWLQWLNPIILSGMIMYWAVQILRHPYCKRKLLETWQWFRGLGKATTIFTEN
jgi:hypothetical protein